MPIYKKPNGKWKIVNVKGEYQSKEDAIKRLRAIKSSQSIKGNSINSSDNIFSDITKFYGIKGANSGKNNGMYKHGRWSLENKPPKTRCAKCGCTIKSKLLYHHKNKDETDNSRGNLVVLCKSCHNKLHERGYNFHNKKAPNASKKRVKNGNGYK